MEQINLWLMSSLVNRHWIYQSPCHRWKKSWSADLFISSDAAFMDSFSQLIFCCQGFIGSVWHFPCHPWFSLAFIPFGSTAYTRGGGTWVGSSHKFWNKLAVNLLIAPYFKTCEKQSFVLLSPFCPFLETCFTTSTLNHGSTIQMGNNSVICKSRLMLLLFNEKGIHRSQVSESGIFDSSDLHFVYMWRYCLNNSMDVMLRNLAEGGWWDTS